MIVGAVFLFSGGQAVSRVIHRAAEQADAQAEMAFSQFRLEQSAAKTGRAIAENARLIHDTIVNTLGAIAHMRLPATDPEIIGARCAQDAEVISGVSGASGEP